MLKRTWGIVGVVMMMVASAQAASTIRLIYGESWSPAGRTLKKTLSSPLFEKYAKGEYVFEAFSEDKGKTAKENLGSMKLPAIFVISENNNCFYAYENVPQSLSVTGLLTRVRKIDNYRKSLEKKGFDTAEACGNFLYKMEPYVGGPRRVIGDKYYGNIFKKLKELDPQDTSGWIRHFTFGEEFGKGTKADGLEIVIKANWYRQQGFVAKGEDMLEAQMKKPVKKLTKEQKQGLLMAKFALYRTDKTKREEMLKLLNKVAEYDEDTFWGTAAVGWLNIWGEPPLSTYWGWRKGDFKGPKFKTKVTYGVGFGFRKSGEYTVSFERNGKSADTPRIDTVELYAGKKLAARLDKPTREGDKTSFTYKLPSSLRGKMTHMVVRGDAGAGGESWGKIRIARTILRKRNLKAANGAEALLKVDKGESVVADYIWRVVGEATLQEIAAREGGVKFLSRFFRDTAWMEQFAGSGPWDLGSGRGDDPAKRLANDTRLAGNALKTLDLLYWNDKGKFIDKEIGRNIATALALNNGTRFSEEKNVEIMECYREWANDGTLHDNAWKHDTRQWREVLGFGQNAGLSVENLRWIHDFANVDMPRYYGMCWQCAYRLFNCFGDSVHGPMYYRPWEHRWNTQELRYRVGGVCGALSKFGSHAAASHGIRSFTAGQPGHCAYMLWDDNTGRWGISYAVTGHTSPHFSLGGWGFASAEEWDRYFEHKNRMSAERLRWKGDYEKAMMLVPGNYQAADEWMIQLLKKKAPRAEWDAFARALYSSFGRSPAEGWILFFKYLKQVDGKSDKIAALKKAFESFKEFEGPTVEAAYLDDIALGQVFNMYKNDRESLWEIFPSVLDGAAKGKTFYRQAVNWGAQKLMTDAESGKRFLDIVGKSSGKSGVQLDYRAMILKASQTGDLVMFRQVYSLLDKLAPNLAPQKAKKVYPEELNGGKLLSPDGMLQISSTSQWDVPVNYRNTLEAQDFKGANAFHTGKEKAPWGMVVLPGSSEVTAVTVVNAGGGYNGTRQTPLCIWLSDDGKEWQQVFTSDKAQGEWTCTLSSPVKAKYVKVGRKPDAKNEVFHLHKILVYGKKLY